MTHGILLFVCHPTYVKLNQSKDINQLQGSWKQVDFFWKNGKKGQNLCKLV
jgi:hypothetical protein